MTVSHGKCHCGQVEWEVDFEERSHVLCHCNTCKALGGTDYTLNQIVPKESVKITKGELKTYTYTGNSGNPVHCYYCPNCTTHPYHHQTVLGDKYVIRTILLDDGAKYKPAAEIWGKARLPWQPEVATTFELLPPE